MWYDHKENARYDIARVMDCLGQKARRFELGFDAELTSDGLAEEIRRRIGHDGIPHLTAIFRSCQGATKTLAARLIGEPDPQEADTESEDGQGEEKPSYKWEKLPELEGLPERLFTEIKVSNCEDKGRPTERRIRLANHARRAASILAVFSFIEGANTAVLEGRRLQKLNRLSENETAYELDELDSVRGKFDAGHLENTVTNVYLRIQKADRKELDNVVNDQQ